MFALLSIFSFAQGASLQTVDGKFFEGEIRFSETNSLLVTSAGGESTSIQLSNVARATFATGPFLSGGSTLPNGWLATDIGETRGFARMDSNAFTLRVEGQSTNTTTCHFISRAMPTDGQLSARVEQLDGTGFAQAGIMIRGSGNSGTFIALSLGNDGKLWFHRRNETERRETKLTAGPSVKTPVWLRLVKNDKTVIASYATDGKTWQTFATETTKLVAERTWRESEGELWLTRASCGVFASSRGKDTIATARVVPIFMVLHGLLGEYFAGHDFRQLRMARVDPQIRFDWRHLSPDPMLDRTNFCVRWTGKLIPPREGPYTFYFNAEDRARLWINDVEVPQISLKKPDKKTPVTNPEPVQLRLGQYTPVKMEFESGESAASVKLGWARPGQAPEIISLTNFFYLFTATNSPERIALSRMTNNTPPVRGVTLRDGSFIAGLVTKADGSAVRLSFGGRKDVPVLNSKVARIFVRASQQSLPFEITQGRSGVFTRGGDFFESEFQGIEYGWLTTSSVLFGLKRFHVDGGEPLVVVLNDCAPARADFEVRLLDGSVFRALKMSATTETITFEEPVLGGISVPTSELFEIRALRSQVAMTATSSGAK